MTNRPEEAHFQVEATQAEYNILHITTNRLGVYDHEGFLPKWLVEDNNRCGIVTPGMLS